MGFQICYEKSASLNLIFIFAAHGNGVPFWNFLTFKIFNIYTSYLDTIDCFDNLPKIKAIWSLKLYIN